MGLEEHFDTLKTSKTLSLRNSCIRTFDSLTLRNFKMEIFFNNPYMAHIKNTKLTSTEMFSESHPLFF
jgi:hypothetical protein